MNGEHLFVFGLFKISPSQNATVFFSPFATIRAKAKRSAIFFPVVFF